MTLCPDKAWDILYNVILQFANLHCPYKMFTSKKVKPPWLTDEILEFLKQRDQLYKEIKSTDDNDGWANLHTLRNKCTHLIAKAKQNFILMKLEEHSGDTQKFWYLINSVFIGTSDAHVSDVNLTDPETGLPVHDAQIPNYMNEFLTTSGAKLADKLPDIPFRNTVKDFLTTLKFKRITVEETNKLKE